jgi:hypothetical protein
MSGRSGENQWSDERLRAALRAALPDPPLDEVDWVALRQRIARDAQPTLARLRFGGRSRSAWWEYAARWAAPMVPAAVAAAAALALLLGRMDRAGTAVPATESASSQVALEAAIGATQRDAEARALFASVDQDALLRAAVTGQ